MKAACKFRFSIDRGGTFTDVFCEIVEANGKVLKQCVCKLLSEDPSNYKDAPTEGIRRVLEQETGIAHPRAVPIDTSRIEYIRMGTTVATNALLERKGERCALLTTKGFGDLQRIGNQSRPNIFDLEISRPDLLYECCYEVDERVCLLKNGESLNTIGPADAEIVTGTSSEQLYIEKPLDEEDVKKKLQDILKSGIKSLAVVFLHAYTFGKHEQKVKKIAQELGFEQISLSSEIMPMVRMVPRGCTTCVDAYLTPVLKKYLASFAAGFDSNLGKVQVSFMQSDGGLTPMDSFHGNKAILSGPAGGVVGYAMTSKSSTKSPDAVIGFDMGGTSTDVSRYAGTFEHVFESVTAGVTIQSPQLDINTVAAGGGSRLFFRNKLFVVGPESAGAHPGPVCYRKNGYLTVTDANLFLGRIQADLFPAIFGPKENEPLDLAAVVVAFEKLTEEINESFVDQNRKFTPQEVAYGFLRVANEAMARPIRNLTTMKGYDVTKHSLACFGGAGPQHCCAIAKSLGMKKIYVHKYSGILSAFGLSLADVVVEKQEPFSGSLSGDSSFESRAVSSMERLERNAIDTLVEQGFDLNSISITRYMNCRYQGTDTSIMTCTTSSSTSSAYQEVFIENYRREYGFELQNREVLVDDIRIRAVGKSSSSITLSSSTAGNYNLNADTTQTFIGMAKIYFDTSEVDTPIYQLPQLSPGAVINGPAIIMQDVATVVVEPGCQACITLDGNIEIEILETMNKVVSEALDPIYLSIFAHRFMGIAEQMGRTLQRTSISVNIKERLDFSCALFDPDGGLVANAPHLPVHLGAMSEAVRYQVKYWGDNIQEGDVLVSNHPQLAGGSHLPDITVITPIFVNHKIVFYVASRGHHADVGGLVPGSMPPMSKTLVQEGAAIIAFKLVEKGVFQEAGISELLHAPGKIENNFGTRCLADNLSDLKAQVAANRKGSYLLAELVDEYGLEVVQAYMRHIQSSAEESVRQMLKVFASSKVDSRANKQENEDTVNVYGEDFLDDGSPICLSISISKSTGSAVFDFAGTGPEIYGNLNAPPAVTASAIIYCLRCLIADIDIPLNQGCLAPVEIKIPEGCFLNPSSNAAVVGGNVLTSQRVTDVVLRAFEACAASQGCMNNLTFGDENFGYYETIAGGAGAGPTWHGCSGVHTHMTNTRITDPEILERRYPVILRTFSLRKESGGRGMYNGGDGVIRELQFSKQLIVSILTERRAFEPYGLHEGENGSRGMNLLVKFGENGRKINVGSKNTMNVVAGDRLIILSPGGGGYGAKFKATNQDISDRGSASGRKTVFTSGSLHQYTMDQESA